MEKKLFAREKLCWKEWLSEHIIEFHAALRFKNGSFIHCKGINISTQWEISLDLKIEDIQPQWTSVFHVSKGYTGTVGDRIPARVQIVLRLSYDILILILFAP